MFNPFLLTKKPPNHLSFGGLDRKSHLREDYLHLQKIIKNKNTKVLPIFKNKNLFKKPKNSNDIIEPAFIPIEIIRKYNYQKSKLIYLGEKLENKKYFSYIACDFSNFEEAGPPLGIIGKTEYKEYKINFEKSSMYIFTDGITEIKNPEGNELGSKGFQNYITKFKDKPNNERLKLIIDNVLGSKYIQKDDLTIVVLDS